MGKVTMEQFCETCDCCTGSMPVHDYVVEEYISELVRSAKQQLNVKNLKTDVLGYSEEAYHEYIGGLINWFEEVQQ